MDELTIHLDGQDDRQSRWFWASQTGAGACYLLGGIVGVYSPPSKLAFWPWVMLFVGIVWVGVITIVFLARCMYGRMRIVLSESGLAVKTRVLGSAEEIRWSEVASMSFRLNQVDMVRKDGAGDPISVRLGSYALNQQVKGALEKSATEHGLEIVR